ncbi:MAG: hypothetical protein PVG82_03215 [Chromatiales bacterium]|jgi:hypothetical protein
MVEFAVTIPPGYPREPRLGVSQSGELPEFGQVWVWDMLYAQVVHALDGTSEGRELRETLEVWAVNMSSKIYQPFEHVRSKGHTRLAQGLEVHDSVPDGLTLVVEVSGVAAEIPVVKTHYPDDVPPGAQAAVVLALAQYFIDRNELFAKELPLHVLAFRKYYSDVREPGETASVDEAPMYAIQKALEYFNSVAQGTMQ